MKRILALARKLSLPIEAVTQTFLILAKRGVGKTYTAAVMAERMLRAGLQVVIVDPIGVWWGLRADADGKREGLPIVIFGGDHADVPLESTAGEVIADLIVGNRVSAVLDLSRFRKAEQVRFMTAFAEKLYHRNRSPLHLMLDEADAFAPQKPRPGDERMLGALEDIVRRGRARGLGVTLITQRSAVLNKNVLTQAEVLIALRTIAPQDRKAIDAWIEVHGDEEKRKEMMDSLASLDIGEAWFWSPGWLEVFRRIQVNRRETFDSSATPKAGVRVRKPKRLARVDLEKIRTKISDTIERARQDDPRELRKRIAELEQAARRQPKPQETAAVAKVVVKEIPVLRPREKRRIEKLMIVLDRACAESVKLIKGIHGLTQAIERAEKPQHPPSPPPFMTPTSFAKVSRASGPRKPPEAPSEAPGLGKGPSKMLTTLWQVHPTALTRAQLGTLAGYAASGGSFDTYLGVLRRAECLIEQGGKIGVNTAVAPGQSIAASPPLTRQHVLDMWRQRIGKGPRAMLEAILSSKDGLSREKLGEVTGYSATGGSFDTYLGVLTRNGLVEKVAGILRASETLFLGAIR